MRNKFLAVLGVLLVAAATMQTTTAAARSARKAAHAPVQATGQHRDSFGSVDQPSYAGQQPGLSKPAANETRTCDRYWCYAD
jgi:hypothetical protein